MTEPQIDLYDGQYDDLLELLQLSMGISMDGVRSLLAVERTRGTKYFVARDESRIVGLVGVWHDETGATTELEPPQLIDLAVLEDCRKQGIGRALAETALEENRRVGFDLLWTYTGASQVAFYEKLGFEHVSTVPDWFGKGKDKFILLHDQDTHGDTHDRVH